VGLLQVNFDFTLDYLSASMAFIVLFISFCVHTYATSYMYFDSSFGRFFVYLPVFTAFMLVLVLSSNLVLLFVGWEGVGIMSYLLVGFWYDNLNNNKCALKALNYNKIGDVSYLLGILLLYSFTKSFDCGVVNSLVPGLINYNVNFFGFSLNFLSVVGFLFFWPLLENLPKLCFTFGFLMRWQGQRQFQRCCMQQPWLPPVFI
jgi:NADH:ubiquinone oxidoreductase subunit 5 (subunit L)/multisubunit Na+/H+ antiporter MnhA subunit